MKKLDIFLVKVADVIFAICVIGLLVVIANWSINYRNQLIAKEVVKEINKSK